MLYNYITMRGAKHIELMFIITLIILQLTKNPAPSFRVNDVTIIFRRCPVRTPAETLAVQTHDFCDFALSLQIHVGIVTRI